MTRCLCLVLLGAGLATAADWPQLLGPQRDGRSAETGLLATLPREGPKLIWSREVGDGYSTPVVAGEQCFVFHRQGDSDVLDCLEARTGKAQWRFSYDTKYSDRLGKGDGPRATPVVTAKHVYTLAADGRLHCLDRVTGKKVWLKALHEDYDVPASFFGVGTSPIVEGDYVLVNVGGKRAGIVALKKDTGKEMWKATDDPASYSSPVGATILGRRQVVFFTRTGLIVLDPEDGLVRQRLRWRSRMDASVNAAMPTVVGDEVFISSTYETGATVLRLGKNGLEALWENDTSLSLHYSTAAHHDGHLYGFHGRQEEGTEFRCVEWKTGKVKWAKEGFGCGSLLFADGKLLVMSEKGELVLVEATPTAYGDKGRAEVLTGPVRAHLALANGLLYGRDNKKVVCWDLRAPKE